MITLIVLTALSLVTMATGWAIGTFGKTDRVKDIGASIAVVGLLMGLVILVL